MCGRIEYVVESKEKLEGHYGVTIVHGHTEKGFINARYNVPPTAHTPVLTSERSEEIILGHWGFKPSWAAKSNTAKAVINARAESVLQKPYFKSAILARRCLIPVTGFFEWNREGTKKTPFRFHMGGDIFSLGGIYTTLPDESGEDMPHYAIITTSAGSIMESVHDRMPVIIDKEREAEWIDGGLEPADIAGYFPPNETALLHRDQISTLVNSPKNDTREILVPVDA